MISKLREALEARLEATDADFRDAKEKVRSAATVVLILGCLHIGSAVLRYVLERSADISGTAAKPGALAGLIVDCLIGGAMLACFAWARRSPLPGLLAAFLIWAGVHAIAAFLSPVTLSAGLVLKIVGLGLLVRGMLAALKASTVLRRLASRPQSQISPS